MKPIKRGHLTDISGLLCLVNDDDIQYEEHSFTVRFWKLCDGEKSMDELVSCLSDDNQDFFVEKNKLRALLNRCLQDLVKKRLMILG